MSLFEKGKELTLALHALIRQGKLESKEADDLRDALDGVFDALSVEDQEKLRAYSSHLSSQQLTSELERLMQREEEKPNA